MSQTVPSFSVPAPGVLGDDTFAGTVPALVLPDSFSAEAATLGRQPSNDSDKSGAMYFE